MFFLGVDGCRGGWLVVQLSLHNGWEVNIFEKFSQIWELYAGASLVLVDIPIGLREGSPEEGSVDREERYCDKKARKLLGKRGPCVFRVPCRPAIYADSFDEAIAINKKLTGTSIFNATWNIAKKIRETDEFLSGNQQARKVVREIHPELCFWALNGCHVMQYPKRTNNGYAERLSLLKQIYFPSEAILASTLSAYPQTEVKKDDILDALCGAITAILGWQNLYSIPQPPEKDAKGLPMEMVYFLNSLYSDE